MVTGFDGSSETSLVDPPLTTARIDSSEIARVAANLLIDRIRNPQHLYRWMEVLSAPIWRGSTR